VGDHAVPRPCGRESLGRLVALELDVDIYVRRRVDRAAQQAEVGGLNRDTRT